jgi:hypothetical protein
MVSRLVGFHPKWRYDREFIYRKRNFGTGRVSIPRTPVESIYEVRDWPLPGLTRPRIRYYVITSWVFEQISQSTVDAVLRNQEVLVGSTVISPEPNPQEDKTISLTRDNVSTRVTVIDVVEGSTLEQILEKMSELRKCLSDPLQDEEDALMLLDEVERMLAGMERS